MNRRVIWKHHIDAGENEITCPYGSELLHVAIQHSQITVWFLANPDERLVQRAVLVVGTGYPMLPGECHTYVGTVIDVPTSLVFHVFDKGQVPGGGG